MDISKTAINRAKATFLQCHFDCGDIPDVDLIRNFNPDCIIMEEVTWCVLPKLDVFKLRPSENFSGCTVIRILRQYSAGVQTYGNDFLEDLHGFMDFFGASIEISERGSFGSKIDPCLHTSFAGVVR
jgi:hypothetical protein